MSDHSVDFLKKKYKLAPERVGSKKPKIAARILGAFLIISAVVGIGFSYKIAETQMDSPGDPGGFSLFSTFRQLVGSNDKALTGEEDDRINFVLIGVGGAGHAGPELADTLMFTSFRPSTDEIGMMSIPRDTIVPIPDYGYRKINHINSYAEFAEPGSGPQATADIIGDLLDQEIHYAVKIDFAGFQDLIDAVGGVDLYVERTFTDYSFPTWDDLYQTVSFEEGWTHMDGETALQYARSRHAAGYEGSDFARAKRQQNVILAVKEKVLSPSVFLNPGKLNKLIETFNENVDTNMSIWEMLKLARFAPDIDTENIHHIVLDSGPDSPLYATNINGAYVLMPKEDDWSEVKSLAENIFDAEISSTVESQNSIAQQAIPASVEIQNGTGVSGLAFETSQLLSGSGFDVVKIGNAEDRSYEQTIIYDLTEGSKDEELAALKTFLEADISMSALGWVYADEVVPRELSVTTPGEEYITTQEPIDFLIILGQNATELVLR